MHAYVAATDPKWFEFLSSRPNIDEVNFWMPNPWGGRFGVLRSGEPLLFKLRRPHNAVAGGGFFEHYTELPISLAWEAFGEKNGALSLEEVRSSIAALRRTRPRPHEDYTIGCILLVEPFFWPARDWIPVPESWSPTIVRGRGYDLQEAEGRHLWEQVLERLQARVVPGIGAERGNDALFGGYVDPALTPHRIGQGTFRVLVTDAYGRQCAVTRERALPRARGGAHPALPRGGRPPGQ
jgi:putative restriction endonuclease